MGHAVALASDTVVDVSYITPGSGFSLAIGELPELLLPLGQTGCYDCAQWTLFVQKWDKKEHAQLFIIDALQYLCRINKETKHC